MVRIEITERGGGATSRCFTHYWSNATWEDHSEFLQGEPLDHTAGNLFRSKGVSRGDSVYVVTVIDGALYLGGRMQVDRVVGQAEAERTLKTNDLWEANDHCIATPGSGTTMDFRREVPMRIAKQLRFIHLGGVSSIRLESQDRLDRQTMRGVREVSLESAALLDTLLASG